MTALPHHAYAFLRGAHPIRRAEHWLALLRTHTSRAALDRDFARMARCARALADLADAVAGPIDEPVLSARLEAAEQACTPQPERTP